MINDKRQDIILQALFKHDDTAHPSITILKRMYAFKFVMEIYNIRYCNVLSLMIISKQFLNYAAEGAVVFISPTTFGLVL
jgi:hypothetical protein